MTVIAWDGKTLAADKRAVVCGIHHRVTKIRCINNNLVAGSGDFTSVLAMMNWYSEGADPKALPDCQKDKDRWTALLIITPKKKIYRIEQDGFPFEVEEKRIAIGSGRDFALAAMEMGANAEQAIKVASKYDIHCGNGIDKLEFI